MRDGQEVVDFLNGRSDIDPNDIGTSASGFPNGVFYGDLRTPR